MIPPSSSDRLARQRLREQASRRVTTATKTLGVLSVAGAGVLGLVFTHASTRKVVAAGTGAAATAPATSSSSPAASSSSPATSSSTPQSTASSPSSQATTPATITPTTQAPQVTYQPPVATSGGS